MAAAVGSWWLAASPSHHVYSRITLLAEFFGGTSNHPGDSAPLQPRFSILRLLAFPKTKITFERGEISGHQWDSWTHDRMADDNSKKGFCSVLNICSGRDAGRTVWGPKLPALNGTEVSLSCVQCFLYLLQWMCLFSIVMAGYFMDRPLYHPGSRRQVQTWTCAVAG